MTRRDELLRWPLWSWRNFSITSAAVLLLFAGLGRAVNTSHGTQAGSAPASTATAGAATTSPDDPEPSSSPTTSASSPAPLVAATDPAATRVAAAFVRAWARPSLDQPTWLHGIQPFASASLARMLSTADPERVPASAVTGEPTLVRGAASSAVVRVPTDGGAVLVSMVRAAGRWQVIDVAPTDQAPGAPTPDLSQSSARP